MVQGAFYSLINWTGLTYNYKFVGLNNYKLLLIDGKFFQAIICYDFDRAEVVIANTELESLADQGKLQACDAICVKMK